MGETTRSKFSKLISILSYKKLQRNEFHLSIDLIQAEFKLLNLH